MHGRSKNRIFKINFWVYKASPNSLHLHFLSYGFSNSLLVHQLTTRPLGVSGNYPISLLMILIFSLLKLKIA